MNIIYIYIYKQQLSTRHPHEVRLNMFIHMIKIQVLHLWFNKIKLENQLWRSWSQNATLSQNNANIITSAQRPLTRILLPAPCHYHSAPTNNIHDHHRYQPHDTKLQGWVHYKKNQYQFQMTTISKKHRQTLWAYTIFIIQHSHPTIIHNPHSTITHHPYSTISHHPSMDPIKIA